MPIDLVVVASTKMKRFMSELVNKYLAVPQSSNPFILAEAGD